MLQEFDEKLILEVEANPTIYQKKAKTYSDRYKKEDVWQNIAIVLNTESIFTYDMFCC